MLNYDLPWPPSANTHWRSVTIGGRARVLLSAAGREYRIAVGKIVEPHLLGGRLRVSIWLYPPNKRKIDIDNRIKPLFDSLTVAEVWADDEIVDELHVYRREVIKGGRALVEISDA